MGRNPHIFKNEPLPVRSSRAASLQKGGISSQTQNSANCRVVGSLKLLTPRCKWGMIGESYYPDQLSVKVSVNP